MKESLLAVLVLALAACADSAPATVAVEDASDGFGDGSLDSSPDARAPSAIADAGPDSAREGGFGASPSDPVAVSVGYTHACALTGAGEIRCWGSDVAGELGDGSSTNRLEPGAPIAGLSAVLQVAAMDYNTCAVLADRSVKCWGTMTYGQLGDGILPGPDSVKMPTLIPSVTDVRTVGGAGHVCALLGDQTVWCWGFNKAGQLGYPTTTSCGDDPPNVCSATPTLVPGMTQVRAIVFGAADTCALRDSGGVRCWGSNTSGQLGDGTLIDSVDPRSVSGLTDATQICVGGSSRACALRASGEVVCWGARQTATSPTYGTPTSVPYPVAGFAGTVSAVQCGDYHSCALLANGTVQCWGQRPFLGIPSLAAPVVETPTTVPGLTNVEQLSVGPVYSCALRTDATIWCWGYIGTPGVTIAVPTKIAW